MNENCGECRFWESENNAEFGRCKRYAPTVIAVDGRHEWPETHQDDWCGDFVVRSTILPTHYSIDDVARAMWPVLTSIAARRGKITYGELAEAIGHAGHGRGLGAYLDYVHDHCLATSQPSLAALVVLKATGEVADGSGHIDPVGERQRAYNHPWERPPIMFVKQ